MKILTMLFLLMTGGWAYSAPDPTLVIAATGTTNNNNKVVITFEVKNLPAGQGITGLSELKVNGNAVAASAYTIQIMGGTKATVTINGTLPAGNATVSMTVTISMGGNPLSGTATVNFATVQQE